jgi:soluble lytic murein transglycosylase-like protein
MKMPGDFSSKVLQSGGGIDAVERRVRLLETMLDAMSAQAPASSGKSAVSKSFQSFLKPGSQAGMPTPNLPWEDATAKTAPTTLPLFEPMTRIDPSAAKLNGVTPTRIPLSTLNPNIGISSRQAPFQNLIQTLSSQYGVDPDLVSAVIQQESNFNPQAVSSSGAQGLMQLMPETARSLGVVDPLNPAQNMEGGVRYLKTLLEKFNGNIPLALASYNAGPGAVQKHGGIPPYKETQQYVRKILATYLSQKQLTQNATSLGGDS